VNRSILGRITSFIFAFYSLSLLAFVAYALLTFSATMYLPSMQWEYAFKRGFVFFMDYLIPVHAAAIVVGASLAGLGRTRAHGAPAQPFSRIVSSTLATFLVLTAGYTVLFEGVYPAARRRLSDMQYQSRVAVEYRQQAEAAEKRGDFRASLDAVDRYLAIDKGNKSFAEKRLDLSARAARQAAPEPPPSVAGVTSETGAMSAQALMEKAKYYFDRQEWYSAHYYAQSAAGLDPRRTDALRLAAQAWDRITGLTQAEKDLKTASLLKEKTRAYNMLIGGNVLGAYYEFGRLAVGNPGDQDISRYLAESGRLLTASVFFVEEAQRIEALPGTQGILFLNGGDQGSREAVYIGKMVELPAGEAYYYDIEAIRYDAAGAVQWHFSAPFGRREGSSILMHCVNKSDARVQYLPLYLQGTRAAAERNVLAVRPSVEELRSLSMSRDAMAVMGLSELWRMRSDLAAFGLPRTALSVEMTMKMLMPFVFLVLSIFSISLGWAYRARYLARLSLFAVILMPLVPLVLSVLSLLYVHAHRVIIGFTVIAFGLTAALIVLAVLEVILLAVALIMLAGQSTT
jgi:tetratricopeptide (TPR) repeat protein